VQHCQRMVLRPQCENGLYLSESRRGFNSHEDQDRFSDNEHMSRTSQAQTLRVATWSLPLRRPSDRSGCMRTMLGMIKYKLEQCRVKQVNLQLCRSRARATEQNLAGV
jgi:hypothetical protein